MSEPLNEDGELAALRAKCYRGIIKAPLNALDFDHPLVVGKRREISEQNVQRLERIFERNGCLRLQEENVINAVVVDEDLPVLLSSGVSTLTPEQLRQVAWARDAPALSSGKLKCISGLHRIQAAKRYLDENDKWWPVRLFSADIPKPCLTRIIESFLNEQKPSDGEIFRKIRLYHRQNDVDAENRWWACLDKSKLRDLRQLLKKQGIAAAFDELIDLPGLWAKIQLGALQRLLALKCDEEMIAYLQHVKRAWSEILRSRSRMLPPSMVDAATVEKLESLAPNCSEIDRDLVSAMMRNGDIFPSQHDENVRQDLEANICSYPGIIPSLWTFFETLKYLEPICEVLRKLLGGKVRRTIRASLQGYYFPPEQTVVQVSGTRDVELTAVLSKAEAARVSYVELWTFCARHFDDLTTFTPRMEYKGDKPLVRGPNPVVWQCFAKFAMSRGFMTPRAKELSEDSCASQLALDYLRKANPLSTSFNAALVEKVVSASRSHTNTNDEDLEPDNSFITVERRCGRPYELDLVRDKRALYFGHLYTEPRSNGVNLNLIRRDLFSCIFGPFNFQPTDFGSTIRPHRTDGGEEVMDVDGPPSEETTCTSNDTMHLRYKTLQQDHEAQNQAIQEALTAKAALTQQLTTMRAECEQLQLHNSTLQAKLKGCEQFQAQNSTLQAKLEECLNSSKRDTQARVEKIVNLEHEKTKYQEIALKATSSWEAAVDKVKEAESREAAALVEGRRYKQLAEDLNAQIDQQLLSIEESPLPQQMDYGPLTLSNASARNPGEVANMIADVNSHSIWMGSNTSHILFVAIANVNNGRPKGFECEISKIEDEASQTIVSLLDAMKQHFDDVKAWDTFGKTVLTSSIAYVFEVLSSGTVFLGPDVVFQTFLDTRANEFVSRPLRKIKQVKRVRDAKASPNNNKNYKEIVRYESSSESEVYESAADENSSARRKIPPKLVAESVPETTVDSSGLLGDPFQATTRPGDLSDSESDRNDENSSFRQRRVFFE